MSHKEAKTSEVLKRKRRKGKGGEGYKTGLLLEFNSNRIPENY